MSKDFLEQLSARQQSHVEERASQANQARLRREEARVILERKQLLRPALIESMLEDARVAAPFLSPNSADSFIKIPSRSTKLVAGTGMLHRLGVRHSLVPEVTHTYDKLLVWVISMWATGEGYEIPESMGRLGGWSAPHRSLLLDANGDLSAINSGIPTMGIDKRDCEPATFEDILPLETTSLEDMEGELPKAIEDWRAKLMGFADFVL